MTKAKDELAKQLREELAELATSLQGDSYYSVLPDELGDEHIKPFLDIITAHTNAEIARTLDSLEAEFDRHVCWYLDDLVEAYITANYTPINQPSTKITPVTDGVGGSESTNQSEHKEVK